MIPFIWNSRKCKLTIWRQKISNCHRKAGVGESRKEGLPRIPWNLGMVGIFIILIKVKASCVYKRSNCTFKYVWFTVCQLYLHKAFTKVCARKVKCTISLFLSEYLNVFHMLWKLGEHVIARVITAMTAMPFGTFRCVWMLK